jgi:hypothetical protein
VIGGNSDEKLSGQTGFQKEVLLIRTGSGSDWPKTQPLFPDNDSHVESSAGRYALGSDEAPLTAYQLFVQRVNQGIL